MNVYDAIITRRSTRKYLMKDIEKEKLDMILNAGRHAPSGGNSQFTHFIVIKNKCVLEELALLVKNEFAKMDIEEGMYKSLISSIQQSKNGHYQFHYNAPVLIVTANQKNYGNAIADCSCALENMMLAANDLDLGSCWINQLKWLNNNELILEFFHKLGLKENEAIFGSLSIGYPDTKDGLPLREPLKRAGNPVTYIE